MKKEIDTIRWRKLTDVGFVPLNASRRKTAFSKPKVLIDTIQTSIMVNAVNSHTCEIAVLGGTG